MEDTKKESSWIDRLSLRVQQGLFAALTYALMLVI